jgi:hypothetical protein
MNVLCVLSSFPGHIDFGGMGFLRLAETLKRGGHTVHWVAPPSQGGLLKGGGFHVIDMPYTDALRLDPFISMIHIRRHPNDFEKCLSVLQSFRREVESIGPDLVLIDRLLPLGHLAIEQLQIPCVSVGSPGGYWVRGSSGVYSTDNPIQEYIEVGDAIKRRLNWAYGSVTSLWAFSQYLNVCFLGRTFYDLNYSHVQETVFVNHFNASSPSVPRESFGVSFGNSGDPTLLITVIEVLTGANSHKSKVDVFVGMRGDVQSVLEMRFGTSIRLHRWVNFSDYFPALKGLAFLGGVGTLWECVNQNLPMLVAASCTGDQMRNGVAVERLGMGELITSEGASSRAVIQEKIHHLLSTDTSYRKIMEFKKANNYTATMELLSERLGNLP